MGDGKREGLLAGGEDSSGSGSVKGSKGGLKALLRRTFRRGSGVVAPAPGAGAAGGAAGGGGQAQQHAGEGSLNEVLNGAAMIEAWGAHEQGQAAYGTPSCEVTLGERREREAHEAAAREHAALAALADQYEAEARRLQQAAQIERDANLAASLQVAEKRAAVGALDRGRHLAGGEAAASFTGAGQPAARASRAKRDAKKFWSSAAKKATRLGGVSTDYVRARAAQDGKGRRVDAVDRRK